MRLATQRHDLDGDLTITVRSGARVAVLRVHAEAGEPVQVRVDRPVLLWRELARSPLRDFAQRAADTVPVEIRDSGGHRLMRSSWRRNRVRARWTLRGLATLSAGRVTTRWT